MVKALIIIDMVQAYAKDIYPNKGIINKQLFLIKKFKENKLPVIAAIPDTVKKNGKNLIMIHLWGDTFKGEEKRRPGHKLGDLIPELQGVNFDKTIRKPEYSAFFDTELGNYCKKKKITELYFCGVWSGVCVYYSAIDAAYRRIWPILVTDASAGPTNKTHKEDCKRFSQFVGKSTSTKDALRALGK
jgi:nicotinamidase-related amidase